MVLYVLIVIILLIVLGRLSKNQRLGHRSKHTFCLSVGHDNSNNKWKSLFDDTPKNGQQTFETAEINEMSSIMTFINIIYTAIIYALNISPLPLIKLQLMMMY